MDDKKKIPLNADEQALTEQETQAVEAAKEDAVAGADEAPAPKAKTGKAKKAAEPAGETADAPAEKAAKESEAAGDTQTEAEKKTYKAEKLPPKPPKSKEQLDWEAARREKFNHTVWQPILRPIVVLVVICLVTSLLLGLTNMVTEPIIAANTEAEANAARQALLPEADSFTELDLSQEYTNVSDIYAADNGAGWVVDASGKGYGGDVPVMVAFSPDGAIAGVTFLQNNETPGLGKKLETDKSFRAQFTGLPAEPISMGSIDKIASSTISTGAAVSAINAAIEAFNTEVQGASSGAMTPEEVRAYLLPGATLQAIVVPAGAEGVQPTAWRDDATGDIIAYGEAQGVHSTVVAAVAVDPDGAILNLWLDTSGETEGFGAPVQSDTAFIESFIGLTDPQQADNVAGGTLTSNAVKEAVANVLAVAPQLADAPADPAGGTENTGGDSSTSGTQTEGFPGGISSSAYVPYPGEGDTPLAGLSVAEVGEALLPGETLSRIIVGGPAGTGQHWVSDAGNYLIYGNAEGIGGHVAVAVAFDEDGAIVGILPDVSSETPDIGGLVPDDADFMDAFIGETDTEGIEPVAGATVTSEGIIDAVDNAVRAFSEVKNMPISGEVLR